MQAEDTLAKRVRALIQRWDTDTAIYSGSRERMGHPCRFELQAIGEDAIPHVLAVLAAEDCQWVCFIALSDLGGERPIPISAQGHVDLTAKQWLEWGRSRGLCS